MSKIKLDDFFRFYKKLPHQVAGVRQLEEAMPPELLDRNAEWIQTYRAAGKQPEKPAPTNPLVVPYYSQRDSDTEHALRMCFSSSCAMLLEVMRPGTLSGTNGDDAYLGRVLRYGDTTDPTAQIKALQSFGLQAAFTQQASFEMIEDQIDQGIPVPLGWLHQGPAKQPIGGGHWLCCIGYTADTLLVHDPFGEIALATGGYMNQNGKALHYSRQNFGPRWEVEGPGSGWAIIANL